MLGSASGATKLLAIGLIVLMAIGSVFLWLGIPLGWIYIASRLAKTSQPTMGPYLVVIFGIPISMVIVARLLSRLNRIYGEVTETTPHVRVVLPWLRSMRGEREPASAHVRTVLDVVMMISVAIAMLCFGIWFFFFAGSSLPGG
jgi:hypothetical protein